MGESQDHHWQPVDVESELCFVDVQTVGEQVWEEWWAGPELPGLVGPGRLVPVVVRKNPHGGF